MLLLACEYRHGTAWGCGTLPLLSAGETEAQGWYHSQPQGCLCYRDALPTPFPISSCPNWLLFSMRLVAKLPHQLSAGYPCPSRSCCGHEMEQTEEGGLDTVSPAPAQGQAAPGQEPQAVGFPSSGDAEGKTWTLRFLFGSFWGSWSHMCPPGAD